MPDVLHYQGEPGDPTDGWEQGRLTGGQDLLLNMMVVISGWLDFCMRKHVDTFHVTEHAPPL